MSKEKTFEVFFNENKKYLPYYFKDFRAINLHIDINDKTIVNKAFNSKHLNGSIRLEKFYKQMIRLD